MRVSQKKFPKAKAFGIKAADKGSILILFDLDFSEKRHGLSRRALPSSE